MGLCVPVGGDVMRPWRLKHQVSSVPVSRYTCVNNYITTSSELRWFISLHSILAQIFVASCIERMLCNALPKITSKFSAAAVCLSISSLQPPVGKLHCLEPSPGYHNTSCFLFTPTTTTTTTPHNLPEKKSNMKTVKNRLFVPHDKIKLRRWPEPGLAHVRLINWKVISESWPQ